MNDKDSSIEVETLMIRYGQGYVSISLPRARVDFTLEPRMLPPVLEVEEAVVNAIRHPIDSPPISKLVQPNSPIIILVEDNTRSTPLKRVLPPLLNELSSLGVPDKQITLLIASGTHRNMTASELVEKYGEDTCRRFAIVQHDYKDSGLVQVGSIGDANVPVYVNPLALTCGTLIGIGNIIPHCDLGYSGGAKIVQPGICGYAATAYTHVLAALQDEIPLGCTETPSRIEAEKIARVVGLDMIVNVVLNARQEIVSVVAGDPVKAHRSGVERSREIFELEIPRRADIVISSSYPADLDYWQAMKGLVAGYFAVKPGGTIILVTPCPEGIAPTHPRFMDYWNNMSLDECLSVLKSASYHDETSDLIAAECAVMTARIREFASVILVSGGISYDEAVRLGFMKVNSLDDAVTLALRRFPNGRIGIINSGGDVLPKVIGR